MMGQETGREKDINYLKKNQNPWKLQEWGKPRT